MTSIVNAVLKATIGLLVNKGRDLAAEKLKDGDVTDQQFRNLVVREINDIKSKLDGLARKDLLASMSFFKEGLVFLYTLFDQASGEVSTATAAAAAGTEEDNLAVSLRSSSGGLKPAVKTDFLAKELIKLKLTDLDEPAKRVLSDAKKRFDDARRKATEAFGNEALKTSDRILAMTIRIMAILLEKVDNPAEALVACRLCIEELHALPAVQKTFEVQVTKGLKSLFNKDERGEIIASVCHVNRVFSNVTQIVHGGMTCLTLLPCVDIGEDKIDPLRDERVAKTLRKLNMAHCRLAWSFGQEGEAEHKLKRPWGIAANTRDHFVVADDGDQNVKGYSNIGKFLYSLRPPTDDADKGYKELSFVLRCVATDRDDNVYVLAAQNYRPYIFGCYDVYVFDQHANLHHKFPLRVGSNAWSVTVSDHHQVFVSVSRRYDGDQVEVYESGGRFVHSFGEGILKNVGDITTANDGRVMVLEPKSQCVHVFSAEGDHLHQFTVQGDTSYGAIAYHQTSEHVVVSSQNPDTEYRGQVLIYTKDGEFVRSIQLDTEKKPDLPGVTVTVDGRIAVTSHMENKVYVV